MSGPGTTGEAIAGRGPEDVDIADDDGAAPDEGGPAGGAPTASHAATPDTWRGPSIARWVGFAALAVGVLVLDQASKAWVTGNLAIGEGIEVLGEWLRIVHWRNSGALFGLLPQSAPIFAVVSLGVVALIVVYHRRAGRGYLTTVALGLLLGGAIGNLVDRLRYGSVVDFVDMGIGSWRFYTYNAADAAITTAILLLIVMAVVPRLAEWGDG